MQVTPLFVLAVFQSAGNDPVEMKRKLFAFRYLAFFLQSPQYLCMWWNASDWKYYLASRDFSYDADAGAWNEGFEGRKSKCHVGAIGYHWSPVLGAQVQESRTEITHFLIGVIATVASLSTWKTSDGFQSHFLPSPKNGGSTTPCLSSPIQSKKPPFINSALLQ